MLCVSRKQLDQRPSKSIEMQMICISRFIKIYHYIAETQILVERQAKYRYGPYIDNSKRFGQLQNVFEISGICPSYNLRLRRLKVYSRNVVTRAQLLELNGALSPSSNWFRSSLAPAPTATCQRFVYCVFYFVMTIIWRD